MRYGWLNDELLQKRSVTSDYQPVWNWIRYHVGGRMFAALCLDERGETVYINMKVEPMQGEFLCAQYEDIIPGYYSDKRNWISVKPDGAVPDDLLRDLLDRAYRLTLHGFSKKRQREILGVSCCAAQCDACDLYQKACAGCNESRGKVYHAPEGKACPLYACAVQRHRHATCAECEQLPCALWRQARGPQQTAEKFEASIRERVQRLKAL